MSKTTKLITSFSEMFTFAGATSKRQPQQMIPQFRTNRITMHAFVAVFAAVFAVTCAEISEQQVDNAASNLCETENCNLECQSRRYVRGACEMQECICWKNPPERGNWAPLDDIATNFKDKSGNEVEACENSVQCLDACQHHQAVGGFCMQRVCWCTMSYDKKNLKRRFRPIIDLQGNVTGNALDTEDSPCENRVCGTSCQNKNKKSGVCKYGYCWCSEARKAQTTAVGRKLSDIPSNDLEK